MEFQRKVSLKKYNTFRVGGYADYFFRAENEADIINAVKEADKRNLSLFVLGRGSNVLIPDKGLHGLVLLIDDKAFKIEQDGVSVGAGLFLPSLVAKFTDLSLSGMEWAAGIPGTVGGAVHGNAGAFGKSMGDSVKEVKVLDSKSKKVKVLNNKSCKFVYRDSVFKKRDLIIISVVLKTKKGNKKSIQSSVNEYLRKKKETQPLNYFSAGSVFKNPEGKFAARMIEECGLKGKKIGGAKISEKHANFIVNFNNAKSSDIKRLISLIKKSVKNKFNVILEEEIIIF